MTPTVGRIIHYKLSDTDVATIDALTYAAEASVKRNPVVEGQVFPAVIVRVWGPADDSAVNLQVLLDGDCSYWATSRVPGDLPGQWIWPPRQ